MLFFRVLSNDSSLGSSVLYFLLSKLATTIFYHKTDDLFYIIFSKESSHLTISLTCFSNFDKTDSKRNEEIVA